MIYTKMTVAAMKLAYEAHHGQVDKGGVPYIFHPFHLAEQMEDEISCAAALLHDVVEDTSVTLAELEAQFPPEVTEAVRLLTHEKGVAQMNYLAALAVNPVARRVKLADIAHNDNAQRAAAGAPLSAETRIRLHKKYQTAREFLLTFEP
ncbi:MAG: HD domain-containing protein [Oscillospiraceae bacterium]|nr:HD domain-containing protein [Oscillospiraceae bacterium]